MVAVADDPRSFADRILELLADGDLWLRRAEAGVAAAKKRFSVAAVRAVLGEDFGFGR